MDVLVDALLESLYAAFLIMAKNKDVWIMFIFSYLPRILPPDNKHLSVIGSPPSPL